MSGEKTRAVVLRTQAYRESSIIAWLYTETRGLVHGVAKGIRRRSKAQSLLERGTLVDTVVFFKPHRSLQTLSQVRILEFFPGTRNGLMKSAVRDAAFELALRGVTQEETHPELFSLLLEFLTILDRTPRARAVPLALWDFCNRLSVLLGFGLNLRACVECGSTAIGQHGGVLVHRQGGFLCTSCGGQRNDTTHVSGDIIRCLRGESQPPSDLSPENLRRTTRLLITYCAWHFETHKAFKALEFLERLLGPEA